MASRRSALMLLALTAALAATALASGYDEPPDMPARPPRRPRSPPWQPSPPKGPQWPNYPPWQPAPGRPPPSPPRPRSPPADPSPPPSPRPPPPRAPLALRLAHGDDKRGIVEAYNPATKKWGGICTRTPFPEYADYFRPTLAAMICRDLGLPYKSAVLLDPFVDFPNVDVSSLPPSMVAFDDWGTCFNAPRTVSQCTGVHVLNATDVQFSSCGDPNMWEVMWYWAMELGMYLNSGVWAPVGVSCSAFEPPPAVPPSPPEGSPPHPPLSAQPQLVTRIVNPRNNQPAEIIETDSYRLLSGRVEVLYNGTWGTICLADSSAPTIVLAKYVCQKAGIPTVPYWTYLTSYYGGRHRRPNASVPIWVTTQRDCRLTPSGDLDCLYLGGPLMTPELFDPETMDAKVLFELLEVASRCDVNAEYYAGHYYDAHVYCYDQPESPPYPPYTPNPPSYPNSPPAPPAPPFAVLNDVQLRATQVLKNVFVGLEFGVKAPGATKRVWGAVCDYGSWYPAAYNSYTPGALCSHLTNGTKQYGTFLPPLSVRNPFPSITPEAIDQMTKAPATLQELVCQPYSAPDTYAYTPVPNINACTAVAYDPFPGDQDNYCRQYGFAATPLFCYDSWRTPSALGLRLVGGANPTVGRLELLPTFGRGDTAWSTVCQDGFNISHAQAVCRDLGLPWTKAQILPASSAKPADKNLPIIYDTPECWLSFGFDELSFVRDCYPVSADAGFLGSDCSHDEDVVISCGGKAPAKSYFCKKGVTLVGDEARGPVKLDPTRSHEQNSEECAAVCDSLANCKGYYYKTTGWCYLFSKVKAWTKPYASAFEACTVV